MISLKRWGLVGAVIVLVATVGGCARKYVTIGPDAFQKAFDNPGNLASQFIYEGRRGQYHVIDYREMTTGSWAEYQFSYRTPVEDMAKDFPTELRKPSRSFDLDPAGQRPYDMIRSLGMPPGYVPVWQRE